MLCIQDPALSLRPQLHRVIKRTFLGNYELLHYRNIVLRGFHKVLFQGTEGNIRENRFPLSHDDTIITLLLKKKDQNGIRNLHKAHFSAHHKISNLAWTFSKAYESCNLLDISLCCITFPLLRFCFNGRVSSTVYICFDIYLIMSDHEKWFIALVIQYFPVLCLKGKIHWTEINIISMFETKKSIKIASAMSKVQNQIVFISLFDRVLMSACTGLMWTIIS